jgi:hypothetical protein
MILQTFTARSLSAAGRVAAVAVCHVLFFVVTSHFRPFHWQMKAIVTYALLISKLFYSSAQIFLSLYVTRHLDPISWSNGVPEYWETADAADPIFHYSTIPTFQSGNPIPTLSPLPFSLYPLPCLKRILNKEKFFPMKISPS